MGHEDIVLGGLYQTSCSGYWYDALFIVIDSDGLDDNDAWFRVRVLSHDGHWWTQSVGLLSHFCQASKRLA